MKIKHYIIALAAFAVAAFTTTLHASGLPAPMPEFLSQEQLVKWQADRIAAAESKQTATREQAAIQFYTGKPFDSSSGSYLFKYRSYDPELNRWTSSDPSGFPDGANNHLYVENSITFSFDPDGLAKKVLWLYAWKGNGTDNNSFTQFQSESTAKRQDLVDSDQNSSTDFLDDGDWFDFNSIDNISQLSSFSVYDQIYLALHGWNQSMPQNIQGTYRIGGTTGYGNRYTEQAIKAAASNIVQVMGCTGDSISATDISAAFFDPTKNFLE